MHDANLVSWNVIIKGYAIHDMHGNIMNNGEYIDVQPLYIIILIMEVR